MKQCIEKKDLAIYLHIPFCIKKCAYCDFLSFQADKHIQRSYAEALMEEIRSYPHPENWRVISVFIGGGTPSVMEADWIQEVLMILKSRFAFEEQAEITIEANPGTLTKEKLNRYKEAGISRLSMGLQSANEQELRKLGRIHSYEEFLDSYHLARAAGFWNINVDLMSALPGQTLSSWKETLTRVLELKPEHISAYSLIIEEDTPFYERYGQEAVQRARGENGTLLPAEEEERLMYYQGRELLAEKGYFQYELSNYAKPGWECRHNLVYWRRGDYLGFGLGAASLIEETRFRNTEDLTQYLSRDFKRCDLEKLTLKDRMEERMFLGLRLTKGISVKQFEAESGRAFMPIFGSVVRKLNKEGLLGQKEDFIFLTEKGMDLSNYVMSAFLLPEDYI